MKSCNTIAMLRFKCQQGEAMTKHEEEVMKYQLHNLKLCLSQLDERSRVIMNIIYEMEERLFDIQDARQNKEMAYV